MTACCVCGASFAPTGKGRRCPPCRRVYDKAWRMRRTAAGLPVRGKARPGYDQEYYAKYAQRPDVKARKAAQMRAYASDPVMAARCRARSAARYALSAGTLSRGPCEVCGETKVQAHHADYSQPLAVRWLCRRHHLALHARAEGRT